MGGAVAPADDSHDIHLLGINLSSKPRWLQLLIPTSGFLFGYLVNGVAEEFVYNRLRFSFGWYFTLIQVAVYAVLILLSGFRPRQMVNGWRTYIAISAVLMASHGFTKGSLEWLNYPAQIMFKSTKVLPVMLMGAFIPGLRRTYKAIEYVSALLLVSGLISFTLADANTTPQFSYYGVLMVCAALFMDAFAGNMQEAIFKVNPATSQMEMLFCTSVVGAGFLLIPLVAIGELPLAWEACRLHPYVYIVLVGESACTYVGQISVLCLVALFGAANTAMVTTARKAFTLFLSYMIFTKPLTGLHLTGLLLISFGITMKMMPDPFAPFTPPQRKDPPFTLLSQKSPTSEAPNTPSFSPVQLNSLMKSPRRSIVSNRSPRGSVYSELPMLDLQETAIDVDSKDQSNKPL